MVRVKPQVTAAPRARSKAWLTPETASAQPSERSAPPTRRSPFSEPPGVFFADVHQGNVAQTICVPGWTATIRPSKSFTQGLKRVMLARAGLPPTEAVKYELDHFVPLAVGGHPRSEDNLWLQRGVAPGMRA